MQKYFSHFWCHPTRVKECNPLGYKWRFDILNVVAESLKVTWIPLQSVWSTRMTIAQIDTTTDKSSCLQAGFPQENLTIVVGGCRGGAGNNCVSFQREILQIAVCIIPLTSIVVVCTRSGNHFFQLIALIQLFVSWKTCSTNKIPP